MYYSHIVDKFKTPKIGWLFKHYLNNQACMLRACFSFVICHLYHLSIPKPRSLPFKMAGTPSIIHLAGFSPFNI